MSVIIKNMAMPHCCAECRFCEGFDGGLICAAFLNRIDDRRKRLDTCPLIEIPDHGDLIDRDALKADLGITDWECDKCQWGGFGCQREDFSDACFFLENAEAVIPAERSGE